jgi:hypothetical protein
MKLFENVINFKMVRIRYKRYSRLRSLTSARNVQSGTVLYVF